MDPQIFFNWANGKYLDYDGAYGAQCVDMVQYYANWLGLHTFWGNAKDIINQADASYQRVGNPAKGDIVVIVASPANGWAGHVAGIYAGPGSTFGQNYPDGSPCQYQKVNDPVAGYLRPVNVNSGGGIPVSSQQDMAYRTFALDQTYFALGMHVPGPGENSARAQQNASWVDGYNAVLNGGSEARDHLQDYVYRLYRTAFGADRPVDFEKEIKPRVERLLNRQTTFYAEQVDITTSPEFRNNPRNKGVL